MTLLRHCTDHKAPGAGFGPAHPDQSIVKVDADVQRYVAQSV